MIQLGGFLGRLLGPSLRRELLLMKSVIQQLAKSVLIPLGSKSSSISSRCRNT